MAESSRLAEIRKKFQSNKGFVPPTPESQFGKLKKSKEDQARAVKVAKARAARYNMTLRALAIKTTTDTTKMQRKDMSAKKEASTRAAQYNATSRGLSVSVAPRRMTLKEKDAIAKALDDDVSPTIAKDLLSAAAKKRHKDDLRATKMHRKQTPVKNERHSIAPPEADEESDVATEEDEPAAKKSVKPAKKAPVEASKPKAVQKIEMKGLGEALASGNEEALNRSILTNFLEVNAPHLLNKEEELLGAYQEQLHVLFGKLLKNFPDGSDAAVSGQQKADKEIADAVKKGDVKPKAAPVRQAPKVQEAPEADDDDDSMVMNEEMIDAYEGKTPEKKKTDMFGLEDDDDDSMVIDESKMDTDFKDNYEKTIKAAEQDPNKQGLQSLARRRGTVKIDKELKKELNTTYASERKDSFETIKSDDSLVQTDVQQILDGGYIVQADLEEDDKQETSRWAVQFQNKNEALKNKLLKQGLSKDQVEHLVNDLDNNTSEML